jgi:hypothetical protein
LFDHIAGVDAELNPAGVADGGVEGAEDEFSAAEFDGAADQGVDDFHDGGLDGFLVLKHGDGVETRLGDGDGAEHALVEIAELLSAESGPGWPTLAALFAARVGILTVILKDRVLCVPSGVYLKS